MHRLMGIHNKSTLVHEFVMLIAHVSSSELYKKNVSRPDRPLLRSNMACDE